MSEKFLKILGICVLIVMLPVLIAVSAVCLVEDTAQGNNNGGTNAPSGNNGGGTNTPSGNGGGTGNGGNTPGGTDTPSQEDPVSYTVYSDYAEDVTMTEVDGKWTLAKVPTRNYYTFTGVRVNGKGYSVSEGIVSLTSEQEIAFEADIEKNPISSVWECNFEYIGLVAEYALADVCDFDNPEVNASLEALEEIGILDKLEYQSLGTTKIAELYVSVDLDLSGVITAGETFTVVFAEEDYTEGGDITVATLLNKLATHEVTVPADGGYAELILNIA